MPSKWQIGFKSVFKGLKKIIIENIQGFNTGLK